MLSSPWEIQSSIGTTSNFRWPISKKTVSSPTVGFADRKNIFANAICAYYVKRRVAFAMLETRIFNNKKKNRPILLKQVFFSNFNIAESLPL